MSDVAPSAHAHPGTPSVFGGSSESEPAVEGNGSANEASRSGFWTAILCTYAEIDRAVAAINTAADGALVGSTRSLVNVETLTGTGAVSEVTADLSSRAEGDTAAFSGADGNDSFGTDSEALSEAEVSALVELHVQVRSYLSSLRELLATEPSCDLVILLLVLHVDERIMHRLSDRQRLRWPPLQREWLGASYGGDEFYRILARSLEESSTQSSVFEVFYYCLMNGFVGRYAGRRDVIDGYLARLQERIRIPEVHTSEQRRRSDAGTEVRSFRPLWYYLGTALTVLAMVIVATALSGCAP